MNDSVRMSNRPEFKLNRTPKGMKDLIPPRNP